MTRNHLVAILDCPNPARASPSAMCTENREGVFKLLRMLLTFLKSLAEAYCHIRYLGHTFPKSVVTISTMRLNNTEI